MRPDTEDRKVEETAYRRGFEQGALFALRGIGPPLRSDMKFWLGQLRAWRTKDHKGELIPPPDPPNCQDIGR